MAFTVADWESKTWEKIKQHCEDRLAMLRRKNDGKMSEEDRNFLIGQIFELQTLVDLDKPRPIVRG